MTGPAFYIPHKRRDWSGLWAAALYAIGATIGLVWFALAWSYRARADVPPEPWPDRFHNEAGGYIPACEDMPGILGDDC